MNRYGEGMLHQRDTLWGTPGNRAQPRHPGAPVSTSQTVTRTTTDAHPARPSTSPSLENTQGGHASFTAVARAARKQRLPGYALDIPTGTKVSISCPPTPGSYPTTYLTAIDYDHLLVRAPSIHNLPYLAQSKALLRVCFAHDGSAYRFDTHASALIAKPVPMLALDFPSTLLALSHRKHDRYTCSVPARIIQDNREMACFVVNISNSGCMLKGTRKDLDGFDPDKPAMLAISTTSFNDLIVDVVVRYQGNDRYHATLGCEFVAGHRPVDAELESFVNTLSLLCCKQTA